MSDRERITNDILDADSAQNESIAGLLRICKLLTTRVEALEEKLEAGKSCSCGEDTKGVIHRFPESCYLQPRKETLNDQAD